MSGDTARLERRAPAGGQCVYMRVACPRVAAQMPMLLVLPPRVSRPSYPWSVLCEVCLVPAGSNWTISSAALVQ